MKKIEAFIRPEKLDSALTALEEQGYYGISITEIRGHGKQRGTKGAWHGQIQEHALQPKLRLELVVHDADLNRIMNALAVVARTNEFGDGKIFVSDIIDALRIRTHQRGDAALD